MRRGIALVARLRAGLVGVPALRLYAAARRNRQSLLAVAVALGIVFMMLHWS